MTRPIIKFCFSFQLKNKTNNKLKEKITRSRKKMKNAPKPPCTLFARTLQCKKCPKLSNAPFSTNPFNYEKVFWACSQKINSLGETGTKFSYRVKVQDLKTCKSKYLATWFSAFCLVTFDTCHVTHSCLLKKST